MYNLAGKISSKARSLYTRISITRFGLAFLVLSFLHCLAQATIQIYLLKGDRGASIEFLRIQSASNVSSKAIAWLDVKGHDNYTLRVCTDVPLTLQGIESCEIMFESGVFEAGNATVSAAAATSVLTARGIDVKTVTPVTNASNQVDGANVTFTNGSQTETVMVNEQCAQVLVYPTEVMQSYAIEDVALLGLQAWLLCISFIAVACYSIPHTIAIICTRVLATMWAAYSVWHTLYSMAVFDALFLDDASPCKFDLFPSLFDTRLALAIAVLLSNISGLAFTSWLGWALIKTFSTFTFRRVGPPRPIVRIYRLFLAMSVLLQLCAYFLITATAMWISWLFHGAIGRISTHNALYEGLFIATIISILPWIITGWYAVRHERETLMAVFLVVCFFYIVSWSIMFYSEVYRWTFLAWFFFAALTIVSFVMLIATAVFGVICRLNFGKGLAEYLHAEAVLAEANFTPGLFSQEEEKMSTRSDSLYDVPVLTGGSARTHDVNWVSFDVERPPIIIMAHGDTTSASL
ncbi:uncharacterized protein LAESUDRAFT_236634 [Laetiporus sulphureus 93-53]|uniref:Uncharacterized protein n=1 Tax=Laetiporus sulphureus 93-53 TaxID=1314785 RepID=A0A165DND0_9APHY|nr:uncharacterized protein LAESUDRAFT_236634 [Laetiporus sulphureus 93-53]KZT05262.1 hypothetical protein LAESUDRAFT_236634 [Laetiporus sulphureus 93-53]